MRLSNKNFLYALGALASFLAILVLTSCSQSSANVANTVYKDGQLFCQNKSLIVAVLDQETGKPWLVTGKSADIVSAVCQSIDPSATPTFPPHIPTAVDAVPVSVDKIATN